MNKSIKSLILNILGIKSIVNIECEAIARDMIITGF